MIFILLLILGAFLYAEKTHRDSIGRYKIEILHEGRFILMYDTMTGKVKVVTLLDGGSGMQLDIPFEKMKMIPEIEKKEK